ncbi:MAG: hypothetical protein WBD55_13440 [Dehalococcoidia bacterium]
MRSPADFLGLVAYLTVMYGRLPDREMLAAAYANSDDDDQGSDDGDVTRGKPQLWLVKSAPEAALMDAPDASSRDTAAA